MTVKEIVSMIGVYVGTLIIYIGCYLIIARLGSIFSELEKSNDGSKQRNKIRIGMGWLFWRADKKDDTFLIVFIHQIITIIFTIISTVVFIISIIKQNSDLNLSIAIFAFIYLIYIVVFDNVSRYRAKKLK